MAGWHRGSSTRLSKVPIFGWSSASSLPVTAHPLVKATAIVTLVAALFSVFQIVSSSRSLSVIPTWLSLSDYPSLIRAGSYSPGLSSSAENSTSIKKETIGTSSDFIQISSPNGQDSNAHHRPSSISGRVEASSLYLSAQNVSSISHDEQFSTESLLDDTPEGSSDAASLPLQKNGQEHPLQGNMNTRPRITEIEPLDKRGRIEDDLLMAREAIKNASPADADPSLYHHIYRNVSKFSKSYKLMEDMFRVYIYREGNKQLVHRGPMQGIYCSEGRFIDSLERGSAFSEQDPERAHMYFLPYSVTEMTLTIYVEGSHSMAPLNNFVVNYVNEIAAKHPFWNRTRGADHFFVSCHDWGPATARDHPELRTNAMKVVCNADLREEYVLGKDASLPEIYLHKKKPRFGGPGPSRRNILAFFAGRLHGHVRPTLLELWKDKEPDMKIYEVLPKEIEKKMNYEQHMKHSRFCICAAGFEVNSPRIVESIYYDCVPVIIADHFVLPFSDVLNRGSYSVTVPESELPNLKIILTSITDKQYFAMQKRLAKVRQHFIWNGDGPQKYDVFHMILHDVWMSRLNRLDSRLVGNTSVIS